MPFQIALSGLNAASDDLKVTANNIANANTNGFKQSRAEFAEVFAASSESLTSNAIGSGVRLNNIAQEFTQGNVEFTGNTLDLAITGQGFFTLSNNGSLTYTRAGAFAADRDGYVTDADGRRLQIYPPLGDGVFNTGELGDLRLLTGQNPPQATTSMELGVNLPADASPPATGTFDPSDPTSFNHTTSTTIYDSLGAAHTGAVYFVKEAPLNEWSAYMVVDGTVVGGANALTFDPVGQIVTPAGGLITLPPYTPANGAADITMELNLGRTTQFGGSYAVNSLSQDGFTAGRLTGIEIDPTGVVFARYTNGRADELGKLALSNFSSVTNLGQISDTNWVETFASGDALRGEAGTATFGLIQAGALEASNVDLTDQLVNMITAQRNFQANAQVISTADAITQTIINIR